MIAARRLVEIFNAKRLPLSSQDQRDLASATKIIDEWDFDQEQHDLKLRIMDAEIADKARQLRDAAYESARKRNLLTQERQSNIEYFFHANPHVDSADDTNRPLGVSSAVGSAANGWVSPSATPAPAEKIEVKGSPPSATHQAGIVTLTQRVSINVPYGMVSLNPGTRLRLVSRAATTARVQYSGAEYDIPLSSTDLAK